MAIETVSKLPPLTPEQKDKMVFINGDSNPGLGDAVAEQLGIEQGASDLDWFPDTHPKTRLDQLFAGKIAFIMNSHSATRDGRSASDAFMRHVEMLSIPPVHRAEQTWAIIPAMYGQRSDREARNGEAVTVKNAFRIIEAMQASGVITVELHQEQSANAYHGGSYVPLKAPHFLRAAVAECIKGREKDTKVVAPDAGSIKSALAASRVLGTGLAFMPKDRIDGEVYRIGGIDSDVEGCIVVTEDDMIGTGRTTLSVVEDAYNRGAEKIIATAVHPYFAGNAIEEFKAKRHMLHKLFIANTMETSHIVEALGPDLVEVVDISPMIADTAKAIVTNASISRDIPGEHYA
jgi:ribose-phosphate pyrophosphokinase